MSDEYGSTAALRSTDGLAGSGIVSASRNATAHHAELRKKLRSMFSRKRVVLLDDLIRNLDVLVYAQLSMIYYMEYAKALLDMCLC